jgi:hypothetical protein
MRRVGLRSWLRTVYNGFQRLRETEDRFSISVELLLKRKLVDWVWWV